jgi:hypothetical protein
LVQGTEPAVDARSLLSMSKDELDSLFASSPPGPIPRGETHGTALIAPGTALERPAAKLARSLVWKGKVFDPEAGELRNRISPFGIETVAAKVYEDQSWFDQKPSIVLDYSDTSRIAHWIRDEIREVGPGVYLGVVYWARKRLLHFTLSLPR